MCAKATAAATSASVDAETTNCDTFVETFHSLNSPVCIHVLGCALTQNSSSVDCSAAAQADDASEPPSRARHAARASRPTDRRPFTDALSVAQGTSSQHTCGGVQRQCGGDGDGGGVAVTPNVATAMPIDTVATACPRAILPCIARSHTVTDQQTITSLQ